MKPIYNYLFLVIISLITSIQSFSQTSGAGICMEISNVILTSPNEFTFDVNLRNTGVTVLKLRGYACGINITSGLGNGGSLTATYLSRDTSLQNIPAVTVTYTSVLNHLRFTTTNAVAGNEVTLSPMITYRIATIKMTTTTSFDPMLGISYDPFNPVAPSTPLQLLTEPAKTNCEANCQVNPTNTSYDAYRLVGTGVTPTSIYTLPVLTGSYNSWGTCSSSPNSIKDQITHSFKLTHDQSYAQLKLQSENEFNHVTIRIFEITGKVVLEKKNLFGRTCTFDFSAEPNGLYIFEIQEESNKQVIKFVKN